MEKLKMALEISGIILQAAQVIVLDGADGQALPVHQAERRRNEMTTIKEARLNAGLKQEELAMKSGVKLSTLQSSNAGEQHQRRDGRNSASIGARPA